MSRLLLTYLLTPCSRDLLEKLTGSQPVKNFLELYGTRRFIIAFTSAHHLYLSCASSIQSIPPTSHFLKIHLNIIHPSTPWSSKWYLSFGFPTKILYTHLFYPIRATCFAYLNSRTLLGEQYTRSLISSLRSFIHSPLTSSHFTPNISLSNLFSSGPGTVDVIATG